MSQPVPDMGLPTVAAIAALRQGGATWAQIAPALGAPNAKAAKAKAKKLAREANRRLLEQGVAARA